MAVHTTVKRKKLNHWYSASKALACMMDSGCFAYVEEKVCLDEPKYIERQTDTGNVRLTAYAKAHEEECFLQFKPDESGKLHYVKLPAGIADKEFKYSDYISEKILVKYSLVKDFIEKFHALLPECQSEAAQIWCDFTVEYVDQQQYVHFRAAKIRDASIGSWLDILYVDTEGKNARKIQAYIRHQLDEGREGEQLTMDKF